jgi:acyl carrier protein/RimJ/RimL family protein N-acetyltransferase
VELLALAPHLFRPLHEALSVPEVADTWRPRGRLVPSYEWERFLLDGLHLGAVVRTVDGHELVGLVELRDLQPTDQHAYLDVAAVPAQVGSGRVVEAVALLLDEAFARGGLWKVYLLLSEDSRERTASGLGDLLTVEAVLRGHVALQGRRQDVTVASITADELAERLARRPHLAGLAPAWRTAPSLPGPASLPGGCDRPLVDVIAEVTGREVGDLSPATPLRPAAADSLAALELLVAVESAAGRPVPDGLLASVDTVGELLGWVEALR